MLIENPNCLEFKQLSKQAAMLNIIIKHDIQYKNMLAKDSMFNVRA